MRLLGTLQGPGVLQLRTKAHLLPQSRGVFPVHGHPVQKATWPLGRCAGFPVLRLLTLGSRLHF